MCYNGSVKLARTPCTLRTMRPRHAVLLTPLESADPICLLISIINTSVTPFKSALTSPSQITEDTATLSPTESALTRFSRVTPVESALTKNTRGGGPLFRFRNLFSHFCALFCAFLHSSKTQLFYFQSLPHSLPKNTGVRATISVRKPLQGPKGFHPVKVGPLFLPHQSPVTSHQSRVPTPLSPTGQTATPSSMYILPVLSCPFCIRGTAHSSRLGGHHE
jgi:hypothetical protein